MALFPKSKFPQEGDGTMNDIFRKIGLDQVPKPAGGKVLSLPAQTSVSAACKFLVENKILSAPVYDEAKETDSWTQKYIGIVDFLGAVNWMIKQYDHVPQEWEEFLLNDTFHKTPISELVGSARWSPFIPLDPLDNSLYDAMILLGKYGVHRVVTVESPGGDLVNVISESALINILHSNPEPFSTLTGKTIGSLGLIPKDASPKSVLTASCHATPWDAFKIMSDACVSAVPIVNDSGAMLGNLGVRDLRHMIMHPIKFRFLNQPMDKFSDFSLQALSIEPQDTLATAIDRLHKNKLHRLYVLDHDHKPIATLSVREILAICVREDDSMPFADYFTF